MSQFAIIQLAGKQFKVSEGEIFTILKHQGEQGESIEVADVLMVGDDKAQQVGTPTVAGAKVTLEVVDINKAPKIEVRTYRNKSRYRRHYGHKQPQTVLKVTKISNK